MAPPNDNYKELSIRFEQRLDIAKKQRNTINNRTRVECCKACRPVQFGSRKEANYTIEIVSIAILVLLVLYITA